MEPLSAKNPRVQQLRRLLRKAKARNEAGLFVLEGAGLLAEALEAGHIPVDVFASADQSLDTGLAGQLEALGVTLWGLEESVLQAVASTKSPQPVLTVLARTEHDLNAVLGESATFVVVGVELSEPGNAGTIIRTAAAAGADAVLFSEGSVDVFNPKVVRATAGALFRIPVVTDVDLGKLWPLLSAKDLQLIGLAGSSPLVYDALDLREPLAVVFGNEAHGLPEDVLAALDHQVLIPMAAAVESINVSAAAAAVCFEVSRQRRLPL